MKSLEVTSDVDIDEAKSTAKFFGASALIALIAFLLFDDFVFKALSTLILAPCSFMFCFHGCSLLTLILIKLTVTLVACCVTKCQEAPIRLT